MKVIFLDHCGVMCLSEKHGTVSEIGKPSELRRADRPEYYDIKLRPEMHKILGKNFPFDSGAVAVLNSILAETSAEIVVSSDWKRWFTLEQMQEFFSSQGVIKTPIAFTPAVKTQMVRHFTWWRRATEIAQWLTEHSSDVTNWVAVDDLHLGNWPGVPDRPWALTNFVWLSRTDQGITQAGAKEAILGFLS